MIYIEDTFDITGMTIGKNIVTLKLREKSGKGWIVDIVNLNRGRTYKICYKGELAIQYENPETIDDDLYIHQERDNILFQPSKNPNKKYIAVLTKRRDEQYTNKSILSDKCWLVMPAGMKCNSAKADDQGIIDLQLWTSQCGEDAYLQLYNCVGGYIYYIENSIAYTTNCRINGEASTVPYSAIYDRCYMVNIETRGFDVFTSRTLGNLNLHIFDPTWVVCKKSENSITLYNNKHSARLSVWNTTVANFNKLIIEKKKDIYIFRFYDSKPICMVPVEITQGSMILYREDISIHLTPKELN